MHISLSKSLLDFQNKPIFADNFYSKNKTTYMSRLKKTKKRYEFTVRGHIHWPAVYCCYWLLIPLSTLD